MWVICHKGMMEISGIVKLQCSYFFHSKLDAVKFAHDNLPLDCELWYDYVELKYWEEDFPKT